MNNVKKLAERKVALHWLSDGVDIEYRAAVLDFCARDFKRYMELKDEALEETLIEVGRDRRRYVAILKGIIEDMEE